MKLEHKIYRVIDIQMDDGAINKNLRPAAQAFELLIKEKRLNIRIFNKQT